jgi:anaerobic magnesium-protoporphyrin IX monomethyl ester cyclase
VPWTVKFTQAKPREGGPHVSALPRETLLESMLDRVFAGEADYSFADFCDSGDFGSILGIYYREGDEIRFNGRRPSIDRLDDLPMPAWDLYDVKEYSRISRLIARRRPLTMVELSRVFRYDFCANKITMALGYRKKSPSVARARSRRCMIWFPRIYGGR